MALARGQPRKSMLHGIPTKAEALLTLLVILLFVRCRNNGEQIAVRPLLQAFQSSFQFLYRLIMALLVLFLAPVNSVAVMLLLLAAVALQVAGLLLISMH